MSDQIEVLVTLPFTEPLLQKLRAVSPRLQFTNLRVRKAEEVPAETWSKVEVLYTNRVVPEIGQAPNLRWVQFHWAGVDHAVDMPQLKAPGLVATTLSGATSTQVAEYILMMLLAWGHRLPDMLAHQKRGEWARDRWERFSPRELRDSVVGIVGYGSIGRQVARLVKPFGATVLAAKFDARHLEDRGYTPEGFGDAEGNLPRRVYPFQALRSMAKECDFLVVSTPLTAQTRGLVNAEILAAMKPTAFLVDISRGGIVDHQALATALIEHRLAGAALDVFPEEPLPDESPLWKLQNLVITPHISGNSPEYDARAVDLFIDNLHCYLSGDPLFNVVDFNRGY